MGIRASFGASAGAGVSDGAACASKSVGGKRRRPVRKQKACAILILGKNCKALNKHESRRVVKRKSEKIQEDCPVEQSSWLKVA
jgi:hypothetical protein